MDLSICDSPKQITLLDKKMETQGLLRFVICGSVDDGKSTIANLLEKKLHAAGFHTMLLDANNMRHGLNKDLGFTEIDRIENTRRISEAAKLIRNNAIHQPYIIHAEQLYEDTASAVRAFCDYVALPHKEEFLNWDNLGEQFTGVEEWQENKKREFTYHWHHEAIFSQGFHQPTAYQKDEYSNPTFSEIENEAHKNQCFAVYQASKAFYDQMR